MPEAYWLWKEDLSSVNDDLGIGIRNLQDFTRFGSLVGCRLPEDFPPVRFKCRTGRPLPDYFTAGRFRFVSTRLKRLLDEAEVQSAEFRQAIIEHRGKVREQSHFLFHVSQALDCLDRHRSVYKMDEGPTGPYVSKLDKLYLNEAAIGSRQLFIMGTPGTESHLIAADALAETILRSGVQGCLFKAPQDISNYFQNPRSKTLEA